MHASLLEREMVRSISLTKMAKLSPKMAEPLLSIRTVEPLSGRRQKEPIGIIPNGLFGRSILILRDPQISLLARKIVVPMPLITKPENSAGSSQQTDG